jgi:DNA-binding SARP family transcriptional activator/tetratricopeptide (TPR) repeat protein
MFSVGVLGPLLVRSEGAPVPVPAPKQRVILAALALRAGHALSYDELAEIIWDGAPPAAARVAIRNYVKRLRYVLGPVAGPRIRTRDPGYALDATPDEVDALRFAALCMKAGEAVRQVNLADSSEAAGASGTWDMLGEALGLWRGDPLADVPSHTLTAAEVPRLEALRMQALEWRMDAGLAQGRHAELAGELAQLAMDHPLRERFAAQLMLALYRCGRQAEALAVYQRTRRMLVDELGVEPGRELRDLQAGILAGDHRLAAPPGSGQIQTGTAPHSAGAADAGAADAGADGAGADDIVPTRLPGEIVPRQLPAEVAQFAGRTAELATLQAWLREAADSADTAKVMVIGGTAGAGKTALAVHWAHRAADDFPDGQLYVNLRGFDPSGTPVASADALRWFLGAFGVTEEQMPCSVDAQVGMYRSLLAGKRVLVILDNARDAAQVRPLLPGSPSCLAVVTSRARLPGLAAIEGARLVPLEVLTAADARELLASRLGERALAEAEAAHMLTGLCSRLPLALSIVAALAAARPRLSLAEMARELTDARGRLDALDAGDPAASVRAVFSWSCQQLSEPAARLFRLLGLHPGPDITTAAAASLAGLAPCQAQPLITELADAHLVAEPAPGRYAFHDLLRAYAADLAAAADSDAQRQEAVRRVLGHYLHTAQAGQRLLSPAVAQMTLEPPGPGVTPEAITSHGGALAWFTAEHRVLLAAIAQARDAGLDAHAWLLPRMLAPFFDLQGHWHDLAVTQLTAIAAAGRLGEPAGQAQAYRDLGRARLRLGAPADAYACYRQALDLYRELGDRFSEARSHIKIAEAAEQQGRLREGLDHAGQALALLQAEGSKDGLAEALNAVGWFHAQLGDYQEALRCCEQALRLSRERGDAFNEAATLDSKGYALSHLHRHAEALRCYRTSVRIYESLRARYFQAAVLLHLGDACQAAGEAAGARDAWQDAIGILDELAHPDAELARARLSGCVPIGVGRSAAGATRATMNRIREDHPVGA